MPSAVSGPVPRVVVGSIEPLDCVMMVGSEIDYAEGAAGIPDIVAATLEIDAIEYRPNDLIVIDGDRTAVVRDGQTVYVMEWRRTDAGGWLLTGTEGCEALLP
jgi:hypothetical protein